MNKSQRIQYFQAACEVSAESGAQFILEQVFNRNAPATETINEEVDRKYSALVDFSQAVYEAISGERSQIGSLGPRQYAQKIKDLSKGDKAFNNRVYNAFMKAGHHIRELTDRPEYILPGETVPQGQKKLQPEVRVA